MTKMKALFSMRGLIVAVLAAAACMVGWAFGGRHGTQPLQPVTFWAVGMMGVLYGCTTYCGWLLLRLLPPSTEMTPVVSCQSCDKECPRGFYVVRGDKPGDVWFFCQTCRAKQTAPYRVDGEEVRRVQ